MPGRAGLAAGPATMGWAGLIAGAASVGWALGALLNGVVPVQPLGCAVLAALAAWAWGWFAGGRLGGPEALLPGWIGVAALACPALADRLRPLIGGLALERVGWLWLPGGWVRADPATYFALLAAGAVVGAACFLVLWTVRHDRRAVWVAAATTLALGALWRTVIHPPSGDEPALLFAAWNWVLAGTTDLSHAAGGPAEWMSRAIDFRDTLLRDHTTGPPGAGMPRYIYHGILLPHIYGTVLLWFGRYGLALALVGLALAAAAWTARAGEAITGGRPATPLWLAAVLVGSPLAPYTVFLGPDLPAAALFALGCWGLARRRPVLVAVAAAALPWLHQKCFFPAAGLALAAWWISPRAGIGAGAALVASFVPEALWISRKVGIPVWPPSALFQRHAMYDATWSAANWLKSVPGLLVDRYAGLVWTPAFVLGLAGLAWLAIRRFRKAAGPLTAAVPYLVLLFSFNMWMGGGGSPGRQLVVVFPVIALGAFVVEERLGPGWRRGAWTALVWAGIAHAHVLLFVPAVAFESAKLKLEGAAAARFGADPLAFLPAISPLPPDVLPGWGTLAWVGALIVGWALIFRKLRS